ncbi:MAG: hypothetical protein KatS3mg115_0495 [Candidatus Poribacteria bacterium]|nr:MAG: hypothetical protein KatS3mg115_0495 [Candidatus Poribacteria bacterium]
MSEDRLQEEQSKRDAAAKRLLDALDQAFAAIEELEKLDEGESVYELRTPERGPVLIFRPNPVTVTRVYLEGRPDGERVGVYSSYLEYVEAARQESIQKHGSDAEFQLEEEEWGELFQEAAERYFRYLLMANLERWEIVERDTAQNLRVCELAHRYADPDTAWQVYQYKGYILMMHTIARAELAIAEEDPDRAHQIIQEGIEKIGAFCRECLLEGHEDAEQITREHYLANLLRYQEDLSSSGRLEHLGRSDPRNVV